MFSNAYRYDWTTWLMGTMRAFIAGGAGAVTGFLGPAVTDSDHFNLTSSDGFHRVLWSAGVGFLLTGLVSLSVFLQTHPAPDPAKEEAA